MTLREYLAANPCKGFNPSPLYIPTGDYLLCFSEDEKAYAEQLSPYLTIYRAFSDGRVVGVKVGEVKDKVTG